MLDPELERAIRERIDNAPFARWMGIELVSLDEGSGVLRLALRDHHLNPGGIAHGGIIASMVDAAIGLALRTRLGMTATHVTVQLNISYIKAVRAGVITAEGTALKSGKRVGYGEATLRDEQGQILARANATFLVVAGMDADV